MIYGLFLLFVAAVAAYALAEAAAERRAERRKEQALEPTPPPAPPSRSHEERLLDVALAGWQMGYASCHSNEGCHPLHGMYLARVTRDMIASDPLPRQSIADMAEAVYNGDPVPSFGVIPLRPPAGFDA